MASREKGQEDKFMREQEAAKLKALKEKFRKQQEDLKDLESHVDELLTNIDKQK